MVNRITFVVLQIAIPFKHACLTMESFKIFGSLITVNLEYLSSNVSGSMEIPVCIRTKWDLLLVDLQKVGYKDDTFIMVAQA